jgi:cyclic pyranopterin phosphate synthase
VQEIIDQYNRTFKVLRVSVINRCNLGCMYCTEHGDDAAALRTNQKSGNLDASGLMSIIQKLHRLLGLETVRLTGGEPLLYPELPLIVRGLVDAGIPDISLTTNGILLNRKAEELKDAGLQSVNVSLDAIDRDVFFAVNKRDNLDKVLAGIDAAIEAGLSVKLNAVILKGINDNQLIPLLEYAWSKDIVIRFLEVMAMGHLHKDPWKYFFGQQEMLQTISAKYPVRSMTREAASTANYWTTTDNRKFGIIANESSPFCHDCNRLRLDSAGRLFGCLSSNNGIDVINASESEMIEALKKALAQKQSLKFVGSELSMLQIGG